VNNKLSFDLYNFFVDYVEWVDSELDSDIFEPRYGLCGNLSRWSNSESRTYVKRVFNELRDLFEDSGLDTTFPFDDGDKRIYSHCIDKTKNNKRLDFVREQIRIGEEIYGKLE
jgi:hypothetical protein